MGADVINTSSGAFTKVAAMQSTPTKDLTPKPIVVEQGLTVFLGGAGMIGAYNADMVAAFKEAEILNAVYGNYSSLITGWDKHVPDLVDMLSDAASVVLYNQDESDPVVFEYGEIQKCKYGGEYIEKKYIYGLITIKSNSVVECTPTSDMLAIKIGRDISKIKTTEFPLSALEITKPIPKIGQFNIVGYSWGSVVAARTAMHYARSGTKIDHLVLIGAPINKSLKEAVSNHPNIGSAIIIDLKDKGDPIYAGMTDKELVDSALELGRQMPTAEGHFYYSGDSAEGKARRRELAKLLYSKGLR
ncbi:alpha/beta hydrolase [Pseudomonas sp. DR48]|uniref:alpha/beta hydrolase n=1 Tax=Pseudomonas sp. DR48 TaxID=2871095 RepID=UPI001C99A701|nr:alpha/beta hydrolase [Pseudomonas sp. DR48]QZP34375.1 alpha/beta hydrolase [Pseudomonas sp. DR48]